MKRALVAAVVAVATAAAIVAVAAAGPGPPERRGDGWGARAPSPLERTEVGAAIIAGEIYVVGGFVPEGGDTGRMVRYDTIENAWVEQEPHPIAVNHAGVVAAHDRLYVLGGQRGSAAGALSRRLTVYDRDADEWDRLADAPTARMAMAFAAVGDRLYAAGGRTAETDQSRRLEVYDISEDRWLRRPDMGVGRNHVAGTASGGRVYAIGGRPGPINGGLRTVERYNPKTRRWKLLEPLGTARSGAAAVTLKDGRIVVFGGEELNEGGTTIEQVELFDPATGGWSALEDMVTPRHGLGGAASKSRVFAIEGGPTPGLDYSSANEYLDVPD